MTKDKEQSNKFFAKFRGGLNRWGVYKRQPPMHELWCSTHSQIDAEIIADVMNDCPDIEERGARLIAIIEKEAKK